MLEVFCGLKSDIWLFLHFLRCYSTSCLALLSMQNGANIVITGHSGEVNNAKHGKVFLKKAVFIFQAAITCFCFGSLFFLKQNKEKVAGYQSHDASLNWA